MNMRQEIREELAVIAKENEHGELNPEEVVEFARNKNTALHDEFEWDDGVAGHRYRLDQAQRLIRVMVEIEPRKDQDRVVRAFVSLTDHRGGNRGYLPREAILSAADTRRQYAIETLESALAILVKAHLQELVDSERFLRSEVARLQRPSRKRKA